MKNWKSILGVLLIFLLGAVTGALVTGGLAKRGLDKIFSGNGPDMVSGLIERRLGSELGLTPRQKIQLLKIVAESRQKMQAIRAETQPKVRDNLETTSQQIRAILTPEQQEKFDKLTRKNRDRLDLFYRQDQLRGS